MTGDPNGGIDGTARQGLSSWMLKSLPTSQARDGRDSQGLIPIVSPVC